MEGLRIGVARMEVFRIHPLTFAKSVDIELKGEFYLKAAHYTPLCDKSNSGGKAELMDLSHVEEEAEMQAAEYQRNIRRCHVCRSTRHLCPSFLLRNQRRC